MKALSFLVLLAPNLVDFGASEGGHQIQEKIVLIVKIINYQLKVIKLNLTPTVRPRGAE